MAKESKKAIAKSREKKSGKIEGKGCCGIRKALRVPMHKDFKLSELDPESTPCAPKKREANDRKLLFRTNGGNIDRPCGDVK